MTTQTGSDWKELIFITAGVKSDYEALPADVKEIADGRITLLQNGERLPAKHVTLLTNDKLKGISEIVIPFDSNTYRVYYMSIYDEALFVLDAGVKKSRRGGEIPKEQADTLAKRKKAADEYYEANVMILRKRAAERAANRAVSMPVAAMRPAR